MKIESLENKKVKEWKKLKIKKYRDQENLFLIEGDHLLKEALKKGVVEEIISNDSTWKMDNIPFYEVTEKVIKELSSQISGTNVLAVCKKQEEQIITGNLCILDGIQDPGNLGTIIRSCVAFGIDTLVVSQDTVDIYNEKTIRASEGLFFHLNIIKRDLPVFIQELKKENYTIYSTHVKQGTLVDKVVPKEKYAIIMGNEGSGVKSEIEKLCDEYLYIPMNKECESLNVGVATSIILYSLNRK